MGESWGDLTAARVHVRARLLQRRQPLGRRPLRDRQQAVRHPRLPIDANPLNYSDYGYDSTGAEVHADGEIWNGTMWEVRQALVEKYNASYPYDRQGAATSAAPRPPRPSPADLGQPVPGQPPLAAADLRRLPAPAGCDEHARRPRRDAGCRPDALRRGQPGRALGRVRPPRHGQQRLDARRATPATPRPGFVSPTSTPRHGEVRRDCTSATRRGKVYIGDYEARATPVADTDPRTPLSATRPS